MRTRLVVGLAIGALGIVTVACSSSSSGSNNPYPDVEHFCAAVAQAECGSASTGAISNCSLSGSSVLSDCVTFRTGECTKGNIVMPGPSFGNRTLTSGNVQPCIDAITSAFNGSNGVSVITYTDLYGSDGMSGIVGTCEQVFVGAAATGATCTSNYDCSSSTDQCFADPAAPTKLTCDPPTPHSVGGPCRDPGDTCTGGYCDTTTTPTCVASLADGQKCTDSAQCQASSRCAGGACAPRGVAGSLCATNDDCDATSQLLCDVYRSTGAVCAKSLLLGNTSADCTGYLEGQVPDASGSSSGSSSGGSSGSGSSSGGGDASGSSSGGDASTDGAAGD